MRRIKLTKGFFALVDDEDYAWLSKRKWRIESQWRGKTNYAITGQYGNRDYARMHRLVMNVTNEIEVDHINGNGLDNQRINLRMCTRHQNSMNQGMSTNNKSGYKGVSRLSQIKPGGKNPWRATIKLFGVQKYLGCFATPEDAARAYDKAAIEHFGEFARTNKMMGILP